MAVINLRMMEPIVDGLNNLVKNNIDEYLTAVEALPWLTSAIALPRPKLTSYFTSQRGHIDDAPAVFIFGEASRQREQTGSHIVYAEPGGGHDLTLQYVMQGDNPEILRRQIYRVALALNQMIADNHMLGGKVMYIEVVSTDYESAFVLIDRNNIFEQSVQLTLLAQTQELT